MIGTMGVTRLPREGSNPTVIGQILAQKELVRRDFESVEGAIHLVN